MVPMTLHRKYGVVQYLSYPGSDHHVVTTSVNGSSAYMHAVADYQRAIHEAIQIADVKRDQPIVVNLRCWHIRDLCWSLGIDPKSLSISRDEVITTLKKVLRDCNNIAVRRAAYDELVKLGVF